jgi:hypothetical protein
MSEAMLYELIPGFLGSFLLFSAIVIKNKIISGRLLLGYWITMLTWTVVHLVINLLNPTHWLIADELVALLWLAALIPSVIFLRLTWRRHREDVRRREEERLEQIRSSHERID